jgi:hypothetical protein
MSYAVCHPSGVKSPRLYRIKVNGGKMLGYVPDETMWGSDPLPIRGDEVIVHLGDEPPVGSVYGVWVEPVDKRWVVPNYGNVYCYVPKLPDATVERMKQAFQKALARVRKLGPQCDWETVTEVRNPRGNKLGTYTYKSNGVDRLKLYHHEGTGLREMVKTIAHELGHGVWFRHMTPEARSDWIELHERMVRVQSVSVKDVKLMLRDMRQLGSVRDYSKEAEPEEIEAAKLYLDWLKRVHKITRLEVQDLIAAGRNPPIPDTHIHRSDFDAAITLYGKNSPDELFCEALSSLVVGDLANKEIEKMLRRM